MAQTLFKNFSLLDPERDELLPGHQLLVEDGRIREVSEGEITAANARVVDCRDGTLMPGLIDSHVHVVLSEVYISNMQAVPITLMTANAMAEMKAMLYRGFTTVRDTGGADWGLRQGVDQGLIEGPRLFVAGRAIGPTGGHSDARRRTDTSLGCPCCDAMAHTMCIADGEAAVRKEVREQMRQGCDHVKIMMSGGVASPYDPPDSMQYSVKEVRAAVEEATAFERYVTAHAYTPQAITRAAQSGVRCIEHGNLIDEDAAALMADKNMLMVANLVAYYAMRERAAEFGMTADMLEKNDLVIDGGLRSLEICKRAGVPVAYGSDLLGKLRIDQSREFVIRSEVLPAIDIIRSATVIGAQVLRKEGELGCLKPGAHADILVVDGNPLSNLELLTGQGKNLKAIMKGGVFHKCAL